MVRKFWALWPFRKNWASCGQDFSGWGVLWPGIFRDGSFCGQDFFCELVTFVSSSLRLVHVWSKLQPAVRLDHVEVLVENAAGILFGSVQRRGFGWACGQHFVQRGGYPRPKKALGAFAFQ